MGLEKLRKKILFTLLAVVIVALLIAVPKLDLLKDDMSGNIKKITGAVAQIDSGNGQTFVENAKAKISANPIYLLIGVIVLAWLFGMFKR